MKAALIFLVLGLGLPAWSKPLDKSSSCNSAIRDQRYGIDLSSLPLAIAPDGRVDTRSSHFWDIKRTNQDIFITSSRIGNKLQKDHEPMVITLDGQKRVKDVSFPDFKPKFDYDAANPPLVYHMGYGDDGQCFIESVQSVDKKGEKHYWINADLCRDLKDIKGLKDKQVNFQNHGATPPVDPAVSAIMDKYHADIEYPALLPGEIHNAFTMGQSQKTVDSMVQNPTYNAAAYLVRCENTGVMAGLSSSKATKVAVEQLPSGQIQVINELPKEQPKN